MERTRKKKPEGVASTKQSCLAPDLGLALYLSNKEESN